MTVIIVAQDRISIRPTRPLHHQSRRSTFDSFSLEATYDLAEHQSALTSQNHHRFSFACYHSSYDTYTSKIEALLASCLALPCLSMPSSTTTMYYYTQNIPYYECVLHVCSYECQKNPSTHAQRRADRGGTELAPRLSFTTHLIFWMLLVLSTFYISSPPIVIIIIIISPRWVNI
jgi:hypothetical protein